MLGDGVRKQGWREEKKKKKKGRELGLRVS